MENNKISVITVVYNAVNTLESTIVSLLKQDNSLYEYWIIDGGSTDGSLELIKKYECYLAGWISEPDKGIYDAMNKGIDRVTGDWVYFLGADDILHDGILHTIKGYLNKKYSMIYGDVSVGPSFTKRIPSYFNRRTIFQNTIHHQGAFYNKELFKNFRYDISLKIISDYELNLHIFLEKMAVLKVPIVVAHCAEGGASSYVPLSIQETNFIRSKFIRSTLLNKSLSSLLKLYFFQKKLRSFC